MSTYTPTGASQSIQLDENNNFIDPVTGELMHQLTVEEMPRHTFGAELYATDAVRPTAHWINEDSFYKDSTVWSCPACKGKFVLHGGTPENENFQYCSAYGARMVNADD